MSPWLILAALLVLAAATYITALNTALMSFSRSALQRRCEDLGRLDAAQWLIDRLDPVLLTVSFIRILIRAAFLILVIAIVIDLRTGPVEISWPALILGGVIAALLSWLCNAVVGSSLARHAALPIVVGAMPLLRAVTVVFSPVARAVRFVDEAIRRLTGANLRQDEAEQELLRNIEDTQREGGLDEASVTLIENVVEFSNTDVSEIMTPRTDIDGIALTDDLAEIRQFIIKVGHSRIPVFEDNLDNILGILYAKDLIRFIGEDAADFRMKPLLRKPIVVPETKPVSELLADFQQNEVHMAIVIDEYGGTAGLVTIEDVLEEIVGEIHDEHEPEDEELPNLTRIDESRAEVDGRYYIDDLNEELGLDLPEDDDYDTVGGFFMTKLGRVPQPGETYETPQARFTALEATPTHVKRIAVELLETASVNGNGNGKSNGGSDGQTPDGNGSQTTAGRSAAK